MENSVYNMSFLEYLQNNRGNYVIMVSRYQYAISVNEDLTHEEMVVRLLKKTRPDMNINNSYKNDTIFILGSPNYMAIDFQNITELSKEQYQCLSEVLYYVKQYNDDCEANYQNPYEISISGVKQFNIDNKGKIDIVLLLEQLKKYVKDYLPKQSEVIIGRKIDDSLDYRLR